MKAVKQCVTLPYSAAQMYAIVNAIEDYSSYLPWCSASEVFSRTPHEVVASITVTKGGAHSTFTTRNALIPNQQMELLLLDGPFKTWRGLWQFIAVDDQTCEVKFELDFDFHSKLLEMMVGPIFMHVTEGMVDAFAQRAKELHGAR